RHGCYGRRWSGYRLARHAESGWSYRHLPGPSPDTRADGTGPCDPAGCFSTPAAGGPAAAVGDAPWAESGLPAPAAPRPWLCSLCPGDGPAWYPRPSPPSGPPRG